MTEAPLTNAALAKIQQWQAAVESGGGPALPSGRRPGGPRATPLSGTQAPTFQPPAPPRLPPTRPPTGGAPPPPPEPFEQLARALKPEREPLLSKVRTAIPREFYDRNFVLGRLERETGIPVHQLAQVVPGSQGAAENILRLNQLPVVAKVGKDVVHLEQYMVLQRSSDLLTRFPGTRLPGGFTGVTQVQRGLDAINKLVGAERFATIEQAAKDLWRMNDELGIKALKDEGILSDEAYLAMKTTHPHYIPFQRADFVDTIHQSFTKPEANVSSTGIKRIGEAGSERALDKPLERLLGDMYKTQGVIFRNRAAKGIVEALEEMQKTTGTPFVRYIEPKRAMNLAERVTGERLPRLSKAEHGVDWDTISFYKDGVKHTVEIPTQYAAVAKGLEAQPDNILLQVARAVNAPLRAGAITYNPAYVPVNIMRDAISALFREKLIPFGPDYLRGLQAAITKNSLFNEAAQSGALMSGIIDDMKSPFRGGPKVFQRGALDVKNPLDALLVLPRLINAVNVLAERAPRLGTFGKLRAEGVGVLEAAVRTREVTVDFAKAGNTMRVINQIIPFSNAAVQGQANLVRTIVAHPARSAVFGAAFVMPTVLARLNNMRYETSEQIPDYEYTRSWVIQVGEGTRKDATKFPIYIKIPKGEIAGMFSFPAEALFNLARKTEDRSAVELLLNAGRDAALLLSPVDPSLVPPVPIVQTGVGLATGVDLFTGGPIVPRREQGLLPEQQFGPETSATAIAIGQKFGVSPRMIDFAIKDYLAGAGQSANWMLSAGMEALGFQPEQFGEAFAEEAPTGAEALSRVPGPSRFVGTRATQPERRGWDRFNAAVEQTNRAFGDVPDMNRLGVRLGEVGTTIGKVELSPSDRARYQELAGGFALDSVARLIKTSEYRAANDVGKKAMLLARMDAARARARPIVRGGLRANEAAPSAPLPSAPVAPAAPVAPGMSRSQQIRQQRQLQGAGAR